MVMNQEEMIEEMEDVNIRTIDRASGILIGIVGLMGVAMPFTKQPLRESLQLGMAGIGLTISLFTLISKSTERTTSLELNNKSNGQKN